MDRENNAAHVYTELLSRGLTILINVGNYDMKDGVRSTLEWIKKIDFPGREMFDLQSRKVYRYYDQFTGHNNVGGWYRHHGNFTTVIVPNAGHMVPAYQPYITSNFVKNLIERGHLHCETEDNGLCPSVATHMCSYMKDCHGNGKCNSHGKCECRTGFFGADCSTKITDVSSFKVSQAIETVKSSKWSYYSMPATADADYTLTISSDRPVEVYLKQGISQDLPDGVNYDIRITG